jgi:hypothetical protein
LAAVFVTKSKTVILSFRSVLDTGTCCTVLVTEKLGCNFFLLVCFKIFDSNNDGVLSVEELRLMAECMLRARLSTNQSTDNRLSANQKTGCKMPTNQSNNSRPSTIQRGSLAELNAQTGKNDYGTKIPTTVNNKCVQSLKAQSQMIYFNAGNTASVFS